MNAPLICRQTADIARISSNGCQFFIDCINVEILMVAKLENVSETAYGKIIWSLCRIAPQV
jgi:hypothetical protein